MSGDTGTFMMVSDYAKFFDMLLRNGIGAKGERVLSVQGVDALCKRRLTGINTDNGMGRMMGINPGAKYPTSFNFGWAVTHPGDGEGITGYAMNDHPQSNYWSGYAGTHVRFYKDEESYMVIGIQVMDHVGAGMLDNVLRTPLVATFLDCWR